MRHPLMPSNTLNKMDEVANPFNTFNSFLPLSVCLCFCLCLCQSFFRGEGSEACSSDA